MPQPPAWGAVVNGDIELELGAGSSAGSYSVRVIRSAAGGEPAGALELDVNEVLARREHLETVLLASAVGRRSLPKAEQPVREVGQQLFQALFSGPVYGMYRASLGIALKEGKRLRVVLRLTAPELAALPWETLFDPEIGTYLCRQEPLVRHVDAPYTAGPDTAGPVEARPPLRILGMVASPRGLPLLDVEAEKDHLAEALAGPAAEGLVEVVWIPEATWEGVHAHLLAGEWHVLHFVGHGDYDVQTDEGILALVGADGRADLVDARRLADLLGEAQPTPQLVVLNSCSSGQAGTNDLFSGTAATLARCGISAVAAMQFSISDDAAIAFARGFYTAIAHGRNVDEAARSGRISILGARGSLEWVTPVLYVRDQARRLVKPGTGPDIKDVDPRQTWLTKLVKAGRSAMQEHRRRTAVIGAALAAIAAGFLIFILVRPLDSHPAADRGWPSALGGTIYRRPAVTGNAVYISDADGHVYALDAATGSRLWVYPDKSGIGAVYSRPTVTDGTVYFGSEGGTIYAVSEKTGRPRWQVRVGVPLRSNLQYVNGIIYFGTGNHDFRALQASDGSPYWKSVPLAGAFEHGPAVYTNEIPSLPLRNRKIYMGAGGFLYALNAATGNMEWKQWIGSGDGSIPVVSPDGKTVYVGGGGNALHALSAADGKPRWKQPFALRAPVQNQPAVSHHVVYFGSGDHVYAVNANKTLYWQSRSFGAPVTGLVVANGSVYLGAGNGVYCLDHTTGRQCQGWRPYQASSQVTGPALGGGRIYFGALDGNIYALTSRGTLARPNS